MIKIAFRFLRTNNNTNIVLYCIECFITDVSRGYFFACERIVCHPFIRSDCAFRFCSTHMLPRLCARWRDFNKTNLLFSRVHAFHVHDSRSRIYERHRNINSSFQIANRNLGIETCTYALGRIYEDNTRYIYNPTRARSHCYHEY